MKTYKMLIITFILVFVIACTSLNANDPITFINTFGGEGLDRAYCVKQTTDGGYIIVGETDSFGAGKLDVYLIKTDALGNEIWTKTFGGYSNDIGYGVEQTTDGGYIIAGTTDNTEDSTEEIIFIDIDVYLIKTDSSGNEIWSRTFGGDLAEYSFSMEQTSDGGYILVGSTESFNAGYGRANVYIIKTDSEGNEIWSKSIGGRANESGKSVKQTTDGSFIITGWTRSYGEDGSNVYLIKIDPEGNELWTKTFGGNGCDRGSSVIQITDGGYVITGETDTFGAGKADVYLIKTDSDGNEIWYKTFGGSGDDKGVNIHQTTDGGYVITGRTDSFGEGEDDVYLIKTDSNGNEVWYKTFGGFDYDYGKSVSQTSDGGFIIVGRTGSFGVRFINLISNIYFIKTNAEGNVE